MYSESTIPMFFVRSPCQRVSHFKEQKEIEREGTVGVQEESCVNCLCTVTQLEIYAPPLNQVILTKIETEENEISGKIFRLFC